MNAPKTSPSFERCHAITAKWEGGWANDPHDPGGKTMYGVTHRTYDAYRDRKGMPRRSVRKITHVEALEIYFNNYWLEVGANMLFAGVDLATYDFAVNSGPSRARRHLIASLDADDQHDQTVKKLCQSRLRFVKGLSTFWRFGRGWTNRIADVQAKGMAWALAAMNAAPEAIARRLEQEAGQSNSRAKKDQAMAGTAAGGTAAGGMANEPVTQTVAPDQADQIAGWGLAAIIILGCLVVAFFVWRSMTQQEQRNAFQREAEAVRKGVEHG